MAAKRYNQVISAAKNLLKANKLDCDAMYMLAVAFVQLGDYNKANGLIHRMKEVDEEHIGSYMVEVYISQKRKKFVQEKDQLEQLIERINLIQQKEPLLWHSSLAEAWSHLGFVYTILGLPEKALASFLQSGIPEKNRKQAICEYSNALFVANYIENMPYQKIKDLHKSYTEFFRGMSRYPHFLQNKKTLRIGYISPDLRLHPVAFFAKVLLTQYTDELFEVYCYSASKEDSVSQQLKKKVVWRNIQGWEDFDAARQIYEDKIDILVDLSGHTKNNCLSVLAYQPAPAQVSGIGYFNTTGLETIQYFLTDKYCNPEGHVSDEFTETLLTLQHSHFCYMPVNDMPACPSTAACKKNGWITFGSFNNFNKVTDQMLGLWKQILEGVPNSKLILKSQIFSSEEGCVFMQQRFQRLQMDVERIELRGLSEDYLEQYADIDIALDTSPYTGGVTTCEALYMGVPVITLCGNRHGARFGYSLLMNAGLAEFIAFTPEEYVDKAVVLAKDFELLSDLRHTLRLIVEKSDLMNSKQYIYEIEQAYRIIWKNEMKKQDKHMMSEKEITEKISILWKFIYQKKYEEAEVLAQCILLADTQNREVMEILTGIYIECGRNQKARHMAEKLLQKQTYAYGLFLAARVEYLEENWSAVIEKAKKALQLKPQSNTETISRIYNLLGNAYKNIGESIKSVESYKKAVLYANGSLNKSIDYSNYLFNLHYLPSVKEKEMYEAHRKYNDFFTGILPYIHERKRRHRKIRIGYISPDLRYHVVVFFSYAFFRYYDKERFEVICYARCKEDAVSKDITNLVDGWRNISGMDEAQAAKCIYDDEIDILFDLSGHTKGSCLPILAYKPAPVQISGIGYFDTTGLLTVDYFWADHYTDTEGLTETSFSETILRLPHSHFCYMPPDTMPECCEETPARRTGCITFGSFNNFTKTTDEMLIVWREILERVPHSRLLLKSRIFGSASGREQIKKRLTLLRFDLDCIEMRPETTTYLEEYKDVDIALDTYPYPGGGTTCEALYMGVPVITLVGERHGARFGYSLLKNIGLDDCCAFSKEEYIDIAIRLAEDLTLLDDLHNNLRQKMLQSPLMQGEAYMQDAEQAYDRIYEAFLLNRSLSDGNLIKADLGGIEQGAREAFIQRNWQELFYLSSRYQSFYADSPDMLYFLAIACFKLDKKERTLAAVERVLALPEPLHQAEAEAIKGICLQQKCQYMEALKSLHAAIEMGLPTNSEVMNNPYRYIAELQAKLGIIDTIDSYGQAINNAANTEEREALYAGYIKFLRHRGEDILPIAKEYNALFSVVQKKKRNQTTNHDKIRIGYLSSAFCDSPMFYLYHQLLACYDREHFEVYAYSVGKTNDGFTEHCKGLVDKWQDMQDIKAEDIAEMVLQDAIDILVDVSGSDSVLAARVFAYQAAPVQISGWQSLSMFLDTTDYVIADSSIVTDEFVHCFSEQKVIRIPSVLCYTGRSDIMPVEQLPFHKNGYMTFGSFAPHSALTDEILSIWQEILREQPMARLVIYSDVFADDGAANMFGQRLENQGFDLERVDLLDIPEDTMTGYSTIDIVLDTYPYSDGISICNALYMGVPAVSLHGTGLDTGAGKSILKNAGLEELAVGDGTSYKEKILALSMDTDLLDMLHTNLRSIIMQSDLMNEKFYLKNIEEIYYLAWKKVQFRDGN